MRANLKKSFLTGLFVIFPLVISIALLVWFFEPLMVPLLGFAAGAMIFLVLQEMIPDALEDRSATEISWAFITGFVLMILVQAAL